MHEIVGFIIIALIYLLFTYPKVMVPLLILVGLLYRAYAKRKGEASGEIPRPAPMSTPAGFERTAGDANMRTEASDFRPQGLAESFGFQQTGAPQSTADRAEASPISAASVAMQAHRDAQVKQEDAKRAAEEYRIANLAKSDTTMGGWLVVEKEIRKRAPRNASLLSAVILGEVMNRRGGKSTLR
ncbi:MAG TPA: hypothetical protein VGK19_08975 [Capsulimonadaceae bacterium]|jgi:hypothetical protein